MNFKKIAITAAAAGVMLSAAVPALAFDFNLGVGNGDIEQSNGAVVWNSVRTRANTGDNEIHGKYVFGGSIDTGNALAESVVLNNVNGNLVDGCGCSGINIGIGNGDIEQTNHALVVNRVRTSANTGDNEIGGKVVFGGDIETGNAGSGSLVQNVVNTNIVE